MLLHLVVGKENDLSRPRCTIAWMSILFTLLAPKSTLFCFCYVFCPRRMGTHPPPALISGQSAFATPHKADAIHLTCPSRPRHRPDLDWIRILDYTNTHCTTTDGR